MLIAASACRRSTDRRRVLDSALVPKLIEAAGDRELRTGADVTVENLAVITDRLHDPGHPVLGDAELLAEIAIGTEYSFELRLIRFRHLIDVLLGDAEFLG